MFTHKRDATAQDERDFKAGVAPLVAADRFGALLLQFPSSFRFDADNRHHLLELQKRFREYPLLLEVRHASWSTRQVPEMAAIAMSRFRHGGASLYDWRVVRPEHPTADREVDKR